MSVLNKEQLQGISKKGFERLILDGEVCYKTDGNGNIELVESEELKELIKTHSFYLVFQDNWFVRNEDDNTHE